MLTPSGRCLCGHIRYTFDPAALIWTGYCHCESCRRATSAPVVGWFGVHKDAWQWTDTEPAQYKSSDWAERFFCPGCGSQMGYRSDKLPDEMHGLAATLDNPAEFAPKAHFFHSKRLPWLHITDDLPRFLDGGKTLENRSE